jgi:hypothetical protein
MSDLWNPTVPSRSTEETVPASPREPREYRPEIEKVYDAMSAILDDGRRVRLVNVQTLAEWSMAGLTTLRWDDFPTKTQRELRRVAPVQYADGLIHHGADMVFVAGTPAQFAAKREAETDWALAKARTMQHRLEPIEGAVVDDRWQDLPPGTEVDTEGRR